MKMRKARSFRLSEVTYREEVGASDCENVRRIVNSSGFFSAAETDVAVELVEERLKNGTKSGYYFLFADLGGSVAAYSCFGPIACTESSYDLYWIAVDEQYRRLGLGAELMRLIESSIALSGGTRIYVETSSRDLYAPTRKFYERCGYRMEACIADFYAPADDKVIYVKIIPSDI
jgi:D-alanine-D-alanine ligase